MEGRKKVFIQVQNLKTKRWSNYKGMNTYEEALEEMKKLQEENPISKLRVLDNNLTTHSNVSNN